MWWWKATNEREHFYLRKRFLLLLPPCKTSSWTSVLTFGSGKQREPLWENWSIGHGNLLNFLGVNRLLCDGGRQRTRENIFFAKKLSSTAATEAAAELSFKLVQCSLGLLYICASLLQLAVESRLKLRQKLLMLNTGKKIGEVQIIRRSLHGLGILLVALYEILNVQSELLKRMY